MLRPTFLRAKRIGVVVQPATIEHVEPYYLSACMNDVKLTIKGKHLAQCTRVLLGGVESNDVPGSCRTWKGWWPDST